MGRFLKSILPLVVAYSIFTKKRVLSRFQPGCKSSTLSFVRVMTGVVLTTLNMVNADPKVIHFIKTTQADPNKQLYFRVTDKNGTQQFMGIVTSSDKNSLELFTKDQAAPWSGVKSIQLFSDKTGEALTVDVEDINVLPPRNRYQWIVTPGSDDAITLLAKCNSNGREAYFKLDNKYHIVWYKPFGISKNGQFNITTIIDNSFPLKDAEAIKNVPVEFTCPFK